MKKRYLLLIPVAFLVVVAVVFVLYRPQMVDVHTPALVSLTDGSYQGR